MHQVAGAHASYSEGGDQEDCGLKPDPGKWFMRPYVKKNNNNHKKSDGGVANMVRFPE
jgi:hypothetical protein